MISMFKYSFSILLVLVALSGQAQKAKAADTTAVKKDSVKPKTERLHLFAALFVPDDDVAPAHQPAPVAVPQDDALPVAPRLPDRQRK